MSEDRFKKNVDWVSMEFVPYGFEMVCTDGWIEDSYCLNQNGYLLRHHDSWKHDWLYWAEYCNERGLALGVYYNPLWVSPAAVNDKSIRVKGTDIPVRDIVDLDYIYEGERNGINGDRFSYYNGEKALYWVDVTKTGAKEYVQGYVRFFIENKVDDAVIYNNGEHCIVENGTFENNLSHGDAKNIYNDGEDWSNGYRKC